MSDLKAVEEKKDRALRYNSGKMRFDLIPAEALIELARVYTAGAKKYEDHNWRKGMPWSECMQSLDRHYKKWKMGLTTDPETQTHHLAQVAWNALTLMIYDLQELGTDDRPKPEKITINEDFEWVEVKK